MEKISIQNKIAEDFHILYFTFYVGKHELEN